MAHDHNTNNKPQRLYQAWNGSNRFFCGGRLIFGPDVASLSLSILLIAAPAIAFCVRIYLKMKDTKNVGLWCPVLIVGAILSLLDIMFLFLTSGRDPGIVPRNLRPPESDEAFNATTPSMEWVNGRTPHLKLPRTKDVIVNGHAVKVKYCDTCLLYRPPRASHCSICNNCVQRFDHHCPWVGQCVGIQCVILSGHRKRGKTRLTLYINFAGVLLCYMDSSFHLGVPVSVAMTRILRNYRFFFMFISTSTILCVYVFVVSWINIIHKHKSIWTAMSKDILSDVLVVYCFIAVWFVGGLTVFHFYLICTNQTTYENFRYRYDKKENPYNKGTLRNISETFFSKIPPSLNNFRLFVEDYEHMMVGSVTPNIGDGIVSSKEKIDIEMGTKLAEGSGYSLPDILRNLDYDDLEDDLKTKDDGGPAFDSFFPVEQDAEESVQISIVEDGKRESMRISTGGNGEQKSAHRATVEDEMRESVQSPTVGDGTNRVERNEDGSDSHQTTAPVLQE